jgi:hypothetical protein
VSVNWTTISQIAAAIGVLIAATSLVIGLVRYRSDKRREYVYALRSTIFFSKPACHNLWRLLRYDYAYEIAFSVAQSSTMKTTLGEIYHRYIDPQKGSDGPDNTLDTYLEKQFPPIYVPIHTELVQTFGKLSSDLGQRVEPYRFDYPSLTRVLSTVNEVFIEFEASTRDYVRDEKVWSELILNHCEDEEQKARTNSVEELQDKLAQSLVNEWFESGQPQLETLADLVTIEEMVTASYLAKPNADLLAVGRTEAQQKFVNPEEFENHSDNLQEAYKGLQYVLSGADLRKYLDLVHRINNRGY